MVDNVVTINLGKGSFIDQLGDSATYSGSVTVNYTTFEVTGSYSISKPDGFGGTTTEGATFSGSALGQNGNDTYTANNAGNVPFFQIRYSGRTPSAAEVQFSENLRFYDTANNPAGQQTPPVSSMVTSGTVCFAAGTSIRIVRGNGSVEVAVEDLQVGDLCVTAFGEHRPIRWLGKRSYIGRFANRNPDVLPICFKAGSLADNVPTRDLWVSPKHAMYLDGKLVPAEHLVNGITVIKATRVERVDYHHVELDSHDVLLAEGAASESFVDDEGRQIFHNAHEHAALYPDALRTDAVYCAPRLEHGFELEAIRSRIAMRTGMENSAVMGISASPMRETAA